MSDFDLLYLVWELTFTQQYHLFFKSVIFKGRHFDANTIFIYMRSTRYISYNILYINKYYTENLWFVPLIQSSFLHTFWQPITLFSIACVCASVAEST